VRSATPEPARSDLRARCRELLPALPAGAVFSHATALALLGVQMPPAADADGPLHVEVGPGVARPRRPGVVPHRRTAPEAGSLLLPGGIRVLLPELAWIRLGPALTVADLVVVGDGLVRRRHPLTTTHRLHGFLAGAGPARGVRALREAALLVRARTDSPMETRLRLLLVRAGLPCPEVNVLVRDGRGRVVAMPDLAYVAERVAIEYDGDVHRTDRATWRRDIARRQSLEALGWRVVTCTADDVLRHPARPVDWLRRHLESSRGQQLRARRA
jgi:hypothetical protein